MEKYGRSDGFCPAIRTGEGDSNDTKQPYESVPFSVDQEEPKYSLNQIKGLLTWN